MSTGATESQIEAAIAKRRHEFPMLPDGLVREATEAYASALVPPGAVIAEAADVAELAALLTALQPWIRYQEDWVKPGGTIGPDRYRAWTDAQNAAFDAISSLQTVNLARLAALIERGGTG